MLFYNFFLFIIHYSLCFFVFISNFFFLLFLSLFHVSFILYVGIQQKNNIKKKYVIILNYNNINFG